MTIAVGDIVRVTLHQELDGQTVLNVLHYVCSGADISVGEDVLNSWIGNNIIPTMLPLQANSLAHKSITTQKIWPHPATIPILSDAFVGTGAVVSPSLPSECAVVYTKQTAFAGRMFRGRFYLGGLPESMVGGSQILPNNYALYTTLSTKLYLGVVIAGSAWRFAPCLFHNATKGYTGLTACRFNAEIRAQRRRQLGKGV